MKQIRLLCILIAMSFIALSEIRADTSLTIYNQNFAVVRDTVPLDLKEGINKVRFTKTTAHLEPDSVILRDPKETNSFLILEQNYRADPISQELLLSLFEGKTIDFQNNKEDKTEIIQGRIIRSGYVSHQEGLRRYGQQYYQRQMSFARGSANQPVIEVNGKLQFHLPGTPLFPALSDDTILKPTLQWLIESSQSNKFNAELHYITGGMSWISDYNIIASPQGDVLDLIGWVTIDNQSGKTFEDTNIKLMAGDVNKIQSTERRLAQLDGYNIGSTQPQSAVQEKTFDEYHLYTLRRSTTLHDRESKQVEFMRASGVKSKRIYVYDGAKINWSRYRGRSLDSVRGDRNYGTQSNPKIWVMREFENTEKNNLGMPLPKGNVRFYQQDEDGSLEFTGENIIDHTPRDETIRVYTGNAFDLVGERKRTNYDYESSKYCLEESFEIKLRNHKKEEVKVKVVEHMYRWINWEILEKSDDYLKTDSQAIEFAVPLKPGEEKTISYKVHYTW